MENLIRRTMDKFAAADFSEENARFERATARLAEVEAAIDKANARRNEISARLADFRAPDGECVAAALLQGKSAAEATASRSSPDEMRAEREALSSAVGVLTEEERSLRREMDEIRAGSLARLCEDTRAVVDALTAEAREAAQRITQVFASLYAIDLALSCGANEKNAANTAVEGIMGTNRLLEYQRRIDVRPDVTAMIAALADKGPAVFVRRTASVPAP